MAGHGTGWLSKVSTQGAQVVGRPGDAQEEASKKWQQKKKDAAKKKKEGQPTEPSKE